MIIKAQDGRKSCSGSAGGPSRDGAAAGFRAAQRLDHRGRLSPGPCEVPVKTSTAARRRLPAPVVDVVRPRASPGAAPVPAGVAGAAAALDCGGEPCDAVAPRPARVLRPQPATAWTATAAPAPTATCRPTASSSRRRAPRRGSSCCSGGAAGIPRPTIRCSGRSTPTTSASTATSAQRLQQPAPERPGPDHLPAAAEHAGSSIRRPTRRRTRRSSTSGASCRPSTTWR